jgi:hypothetical protein
MYLNSIHDTWKKPFNQLTNNPSSLFKQHHILIILFYKTVDQNELKFRQFHFLRLFQSHYKLVDVDVVYFLFLVGLENTDQVVVDFGKTALHQTDFYIRYFKLDQNIREISERETIFILLLNLFHYCVYFVLAKNILICNLSFLK